MKKILISTLFILTLNAQEDSFDFVAQGFSEYRQSNQEKSIPYFKKACDLNNSIGCGMMGSFYQEGSYVKQDYKKALNYYNKACMIGDSTACSVIKELTNKN